MLFPPIILVLAASATAVEMNLLYEWKKVDFDWESTADKQTAIDSGTYKPENIFIVDVDRAKDGRVFVSTTGGEGVPATLSTVTNRTDTSGNPLLAPYPDWSWHKREECDGISNAERLVIDDCNTLWVLDGGKLGKNDEQDCPVQILSFQLSSNELLNRAVIPDFWDNPSREGTGSMRNLFVTNVEPSCGNSTLAAVTYPVGNDTIMVYDSARSFRLPFVISSFTSAGGSELTTAYHNYFKLGSVPTALLLPWLEATNSFKSRASLGSYRLPLFSASVANAEGRVMFFSVSGRNSIQCSNLNRLPTAEVVEVIRDDERLQMVSGMKLIAVESSEELWVASSRYRNNTIEKLNLEEVNFRILNASVAAIVDGTECAAPDAPSPLLPEDMRVWYSSKVAEVF